MRTEEEIRAKLARDKARLKKVRLLWRTAIDRDIRGELPRCRAADEDPQLLSGHITALEGGIYMLAWVLGASEDDAELEALES